MEVEGVMKRTATFRVVAGLVISGTLVLSAGQAMGQTTANPNPSTLPVPTQANPAGTGGSNTATPPNDPTAPTTPNPAPPPTQKAPPASTNPAQQPDSTPQGQAPQTVEPQKQTPQNQQSAPAQNPAVQQTSPNGNNAITNEPNKAAPAPEAASPEAGNPQGKGTRPAATGASSAGSLKEGELTPEQLHQRIEAALHSEPTLSGSNLTVNVGDDAIDLSGTVNSSKEKLTARRIVQSFAGNRRVREHVTVGGGGARNVGPNTQPNPQNAPGEKSDLQKANRPITDPARQGDASGDPRG
jgi:hypothetical protein